jgi:adenylate cyclase
MKYQAKVMWSFLLCGAVSAGVCTLAALWQFHGQVNSELMSRHKSVAATIASQIDAAALGEIRDRADEQSPAYEKLVAQLRAARDANRRGDIVVQNVYTLMAAPQDGKTLVFGVDAEEDFRMRSRVGDVYHSSGPAIELSDRVQSDEVVRKDQWGEWFSAFAPVKDQAGNVVAMVGIDVPAARMSVRWHKQMAAAGIAVVLGGLIGVGPAVWLSRRATRPLAELSATVDRLAGGDLSARAQVQGRDEFASLASHLNGMAQRLGEHQTLRQAFARYVSQQVMDGILQDGRVPCVEGDRRRVTILFSDIRGFTTMAEKMPPEQVVGLLNEYFERMIDVVFRHGGTLDKLIGDGLMAIFGAPADDPHQEEHAVRAALDMQRELEALNNKWSAAGRPRLEIGIGIHSGPAIIGNVGSTQRMEYTAVGDAVNLAARLESASKDLQVGLVVSEHTFEPVRSLFAFQRLGEVKAKGRSDTVTVYGPRSEEQSAGADTQTAAPRGLTGEGPARTMPDAETPTRRAA